MKLEQFQIHTVLPTSNMFVVVRSVDSALVRGTDRDSHVAIGLKRRAAGPCVKQTIASVGIK